MCTLSPKRRLGRSNEAAEHSRQGLLLAQRKSKRTIEVLRSKLEATEHDIVVSFDPAPDGSDAIPNSLPGNGSTGEDADPQSAKLKSSGDVVVSMSQPQHIKPRASHTFAESTCAVGAVAGLPTASPSLVF
ncbi:hypothetical protein AK812_SmicGene35653 [Symbiodinium microadriaticum]|uniref:Uncharacterized protein n=1 Tax=Symbiodinium microadriaticum TaxID=2951 RepID=A0A1Q9CKX0_SYMMI|nr:hypothetical protein AK812_SmicGene35653 [Symbiodinium microadriaticum]